MNAEQHRGRSKKRPRKLACRRTPMTAKNTVKNLAQVLQAVKTPVELLRNQQTGPNVYPGVPAEYTNWRDEQQAWQDTSVLFNQSYHMADLAVEGPDAFKLLAR